MAVPPTLHPEPTSLAGQRMLLPGMLGAVATLLCWWAAGATLGLFIGSVFAVTLLAPTLACAEDELLHRIMTAGSVCDGVAIVLLGSVFGGVISIGQWLLVYVLLAAYAAALLGIVTLARWARAPAALAGVFAVTLGLAWLTWPVWLAPVMTQTLAAFLSPCHPIFALNGELLHLGQWNEQAGVIYHLTNLNQDVPYTVPMSIWASVVLHAMICMGAFLLARPRTQPAGSCTP